MRSSEETFTTTRTRRGSVSIIAAVGALLAAIPLAVGFYRLIGFPANLPPAFGCAIVLAELAEVLLTRGSGGITARTVLKSVVHGLAVAVACWLGVWVVQTFGWTG